MLEHIGITVNRKKDIEAFYKGVLGLKEIHTFEVAEEESEKLFGIKGGALVTLLARGNFRMEVFLTRRKQRPAYNHLCISVRDRESLIAKADALGYSMTKLARQSKESLVFLKDGSGNTFEIKSR
ncbi:MAG: VOC family protein [Deltaproteobacteria bacterium]|nr:VOC family protein [Deltaproteobacteria bacterium]